MSEHDQNYGGAPPTGTQYDAGDEKSAETATAQAGGELRQSSLWGDAWRSLRRNPFFLIGAVLFLVFTVMAIAPTLFTNANPRDCDLSRSAQGPSAQAWFGYDVYGCDYFANVVHGARVSMSIGVLTVAAVLIIGVLLGSLAGYYGGWVDALLARLADVFFGIPLLLGALMLLSVQEDRGVLQVALALIAFGWMTAMRLVRSTVISVRGADYVQAARALGARPRRMLMRHILPNAVAPVLVYATIAVGTIIAAEATLTFMGVGLQQPEMSWGLQINAAQNRLREAFHLILFPSVFLSLTVLSFILMGDALRDAPGPRSR